ncbi:MAG: histidine ammonia-lyase [Phycisphaerales bacterium]|jgi:histidine ammonia-lyase|nr:histidine ammonia-lyase [Phycisphaerales bacterium]
MPSGRSVAGASPQEGPVVLDGSPLTIDALARVARGSAPVEVAASARAALAASRAVVERTLLDGQAHYGINTGFGSLSRKRIAGEDLSELQHNLIRSHAAGVGEPFADDIVRGMMLCLAASLCRGRSGVRAEVVDAIVGLLNAGVTPIVPSVGSVGASGDLAPLAHVALVLIGEGEARRNGHAVRGRQACEAGGFEPLTLGAKEGLALINGTHLMAAEGALSCAGFERLFDAALGACAMSIDACRATDAFLDERVFESRAQPGPRMVAERLRGLLDGSEIIPSHAEGDTRVQDPYSLRCAPVVLGAAWDAYASVRGAIERELGAVTDNPLVFEDGDVVSAGNFHGMPLAIPLDALCISIAHVAGISERRTFLMLAATDPEAQLRPYLARTPGVQSGLMIAQYTAAACCNEIIGLCTPASVANIGTSAGMEDYNSFGPRAAAKARRAMELARSVVAIELLCAAEGVECHRPLRSGRGVEGVLARVRSAVAPLDRDRPPAPDIAAIAGMIEARHLFA